MNVLSLFDGMSCGQIALDKLGIKVDNYFASEIDKYAIKVTQSNYPNTIQVGSVEFVTKEMINHNIDLLYGGSPCQSFSRAGDGSGFDGKSKLFWEFVRVLKETKPTYFLLENVVMRKEWEQVITDTLGVEPIKINSSLVSAQNRNRLYWTNIPNVEQPEDKHILVKDIIDYDTNNKMLSIKAIEKHRRYNKNYTVTGKAPCLTTEIAHGTGKNVTPKCHEEIKAITNEDRVFSPTECERLQTVPDGYTSVVSDTQRYKMLGNGWTVDVIAHIFKNLK
jgi:DNA-cytosine methyltransferase